jgi:hypothetical protein
LWVIRKDLGELLKELAYVDDGGYALIAALIIPSCPMKLKRRLIAP